MYTHNDIYYTLSSRMLLATSLTHVSGAVASVLTLYFADELRKSTTSHGLRYILQNIHQVAIFALKCRPLLNFDVFPLITLTVSFNTCDNFFTKYELSMITARCYA